MHEPKELTKKFKMLKRIWMPFMALAIVSCSTEATETTTTPQTAEKNIGFVLKYGDPTGTTLSDFCYRHAMLVKQMDSVLESKDNQAIDFGDNFQNELESTKDAGELKTALMSKGMSDVDAGTIISVAQQQTANYSKFLSDNKDFADLNDDDQASIINGGMLQLIGDNPDNLFPPDDNTEVYGQAKCAQIWRNARADCKENHVIATAVCLALAPWTAGIPSLIGAVAAGVVAIRCYQRADRDFDLCMEP